MKTRYGAVIGLRPETLEEYKRPHAAVWPEILGKIKGCNISNYSTLLMTRHQLLLVIGISTLFLALSGLRAQTSTAPVRGASVGNATVTEWQGYDKLSFDVNGRAALLIKPKTPAPGRPWIWRTEFFGAFPCVDLALLEKGWHVAYLDVSGLFGAPAALEAMDGFPPYLAEHYQLTSKPVLEGFSRGGLFAFNWAARSPQKVAALYVDAPVCDFKSWPGGKGSGKGSPKDWQLCLKAYGFTEEQALAYKLNPIDNLAALAEAKIPIIAVAGDADTTVPVAENISIVETRYRALGGEIKVIIKPGCDHHPHSLTDPTPVVEFLVKHL